MKPLASSNRPHFPIKQTTYPFPDNNNYNQDQRLYSSNYNDNNFTRTASLNTSAIQDNTEFTSITIDNGAQRPTRPISSEGNKQTNIISKNDKNGSDANTGSDIKNGIKGKHTRYVAGTNVILNIFIEAISKT